MAAILPSAVVFRTDEHKSYPFVINKHFPNAKHLTHKSKRGRINGQGEMKKTGRDPLFSVNQTFAMFRAKMGRLARQSWNLSKKIPCLDDHMAIYVESHNRSIWAKMEKRRLKKYAA